MKDRDYFMSRYALEMMPYLRRKKRKKSCANCDHHDYDEYCCGEYDYIEFEVCRKGHNAPFDGPCEDWEEL